MELQHRLRKWKCYFVSLFDLKDLNTHFPNASSNYFDDTNLYNFWGKQGAVYTNTTFRGLEKKKQKEENSGLIVITLLYERKNHTIPVSSVISVTRLTNLRTFSFLAFNERLEIPNLFYHGWDQRGSQSHLDPYLKSQFWGGRWVPVIVEDSVPNFQRKVIFERFFLYIIILKSRFWRVSLS